MQNARGKLQTFKKIPEKKTWKSGTVNKKEQEVYNCVIKKTWVSTKKPNNVIGLKHIDRKN